ncbi:MAG: hypothetical protein EZS28_010910 [Streblomastix strix]|uniref:Uncharacterized protein n=1 Tax=Streblomastix strix TaxID=222440 RepID=A0A5J4WGB3_9EUKA|nr:MAG: hypothetical protein EZS28_010910 [Streblomastix strix]
MCCLKMGEGSAIIISIVGYRDVETRQSKRNLLKDNDGAQYVSFLKYICDISELIVFKVLQYLQRQVFGQAKWIQSRMGQGNSVTSPINPLTTEDYKEVQERASLISSLDSARLAKLEVVHRTERDCNTEEILWREFTSLTNGSETQKQMLCSANWKDLPFLMGAKTEREYFDYYYKVEN